MTGNSGNINLYLNIIQTVLLLLIGCGIGYLVYKTARTARGTRKSLHSRRQEVYDDLVRILTVLGKRGEIRKEELLDSGQELRMRPFCSMRT